MRVRMYADVEFEVDLSKLIKPGHFDGIPDYVDDDPEARLVDVIERLLIDDIEFSEIHRMIEDYDVDWSLNEGEVTELAAAIPEVSGREETSMEQARRALGLERPSTDWLHLQMRLDAR